MGSRFKHACVLVCAVALNAVAMAQPFSTSPWVHSWENVAQALFTDFSSPTLLSMEQLQFLASNYAIVSLENVIKLSTNSKQTQIGTIRSLRYLRDDYGNIVLDGSQPVVDFTQPAVQQWWLNVPFTWSNASLFIDGILADGAGAAIYANMSQSRLDAINAAVNETLLGLQTKFTVLNEGMVVGNGIVEYPQFPNHDMSDLPFMGGIMAEHFAVFESVLSNGSFDAPMVDNFIQLITQAALENKTVVVALWPGPCIEPITDLGPSWPNGEEPQNETGRAQALLNYNDFAIAAYLILAQENVFFQYQWWYSSNNGMIPCPSDPTSCAFPQNFYPNYFRPLGAPLGPYIQSGYTYLRHFQNATAFLDLLTPSNTYVTFY